MDHENCRYLLDSLSPYLDHELGEELCSEIERHLAGCENCRVVVDTLRKTVDLYHESLADSSTPDEVRQRLYLRLDLQDYLKKDQSPAL
jgi:anti-sigma factor (TIGR02949 family)